MAIVYGANYGKPTLDLNFAKNKSLIDTISGQNLVTFTRGSTGTYVDSDGLIKTASVDTPRFDHNPLTGECLGLLVEEARTNSTRNSTNLSQSSFYVGSSGSGYTFTANQTTAPDGTTTAGSIGSFTSQCGFAIVSTGVTSTNITVSLFAKYITGSVNTHVRIQLSPSGGGSNYGLFNLTNGTYTVNGSVSNATMTPFPNGWYRCSFTATHSTTWPQNGGDIRIWFHGATATETPINNTDGTYVWGVQLEAGTFPTSYIPTSGSTVTRSADQASITGTNFSRWYNPARVGTLFIDRRCNSPGASNAVIAALGGPSVFNNHIGLIASGQEYLSHTSWSVNMWGPLSTPAIGDRKKYAIGFSLETNGTNAALDGVLQGTRTPSNNVISDLILGGYSNTFNRLTYYPTRLQDFQLQQLTK